MGEVSGNFQTDTLTGNWNHSRTKLFEQGINLEVEYIGDLFSQVAGGLDQETGFSGLLALELHIDGDRLLGWQGSQFFVYGTGTHGRDFFRDAGSVFGVSNIVATDTFKLMEFWYQQSFLEDQLSFLLGLYDVNSEFDVRPTAQLFINGTFGVGVDFSGSGKNGLSTFPLTSLTARVKVQPTSSLYYLGAVLDGVPGDLNNPNGTQIILDQEDGLLIAQEIGYHSPSISPGVNKAGFGVWFYTTELDDQVRVDTNGNPLKHSGTYGIYFFADAALYLESDSSNRGLYSFFRIGMAEEDVNSVDFYFDAGLVYQGLFNSRPEDKLGIGVALASFSDGFVEKQKQSQILIEDPEILLEITYRFEMGSGIYLQPDVQFFFNPSQVKDMSNGISAGLRFAVDF